jgi:hypothetical protein
MENQYDVDRLLEPSCSMTEPHLQQTWVILSVTWIFKEINLNFWLLDWIIGIFEKKQKDIFLSGAKQTFY